jgi:hypothetical protein
MRTSYLSCFKQSWRKLYSASALSLISALGFVACDPYTSRVGQYNAGPVDPVTFPPENLGLSRTAAFAGRYRSGTGRFTAISAFLSATEKVDYFRFAAPAPTPRPMGFSPFSIPATAPRAYVFDPQGVNPFTQSACRSPTDYKFDQQKDGIRLDEQGAIFTALPTANYDPSAASAATATEVPITLLGGTRAYGPIINTVPVDTNDLPCQATKSEIDVAVRKDVKLELGEPNPATKRQIGVGSGKYAAAVIIDPGAPVYDSVFVAGKPDNGTKTPQGLGLQRWGWFNQFLLAYLEGGYIPTEDVMGRTQLKPQRIFVPGKILDSKMMPATGAVGSGYDVMEFKRGTDGYSPLCQIVTYETPMPLPTSMLPKSAADIVTNFSASFKNGDVFYCLQTQQPQQ